MLVGCIQEGMALAHSGLAPGTNTESHAGHRRGTVPGQGGRRAHPAGTAAVRNRSHANVLHGLQLREQS